MPQKSVSLQGWHGTLHGLGDIPELPLTLYSPVGVFVQWLLWSGTGLHQDARRHRVSCE